MHLFALRLFGLTLFVCIQIICEEAAAMDMQVFYEVVVPLMEMDRTSLICISTVLGSDNFYSKLLMLKEYVFVNSFCTNLF